LVKEERFYGLRSSDVGQLTFQVALKNKSEHPFPVDKSMASKKWLKKCPYPSSFILEVRIHVFWEE
jgi:hypothetical protein